MQNLLTHLNPDWINSGNQENQEITYDNRAEIQGAGSRGVFY